MCVTLRIAYIASSDRVISSSTIHASSPKASASTHDDADNVRGSLKSQILEVSTFPRRSATKVLQKWVDLGHKASIYDLRHIYKQLLKYHRYKHALEVFFFFCFICYSLFSYLYSAVSSYQSVICINLHVYYIAYSDFYCNLLV